MRMIIVHYATSTYWLLLAGIFMVLPQRSAAESLDVDALVTRLERQREDFLSQASYKFRFRVESTLHVQNTFAYKTYEVTDIRRGNELRTDLSVPAGAWYGHPEFPGLHERRVLRKGVAFNCDRYNLMITPRPLTQHFSYHDYTDYQHINIYKGLPMPAGNVAPYEPSQPFLPEFIRRHPSKYRLRPEKEQIDDVSCWVLEFPDFDVIWLDEDGLIRMRQLHWGPGEPVSIVTKLHDYHTFAGLVKLPRRITAQHYASPLTKFPERANQMTYELEITLLSAEFNNVEDEDLELTDLAPGIRVTDYVRGVAYKVPKPGELPFEQAIDVAKADSMNTRNLLVVVNIILCQVALLLFFGRRIIAARKARRSRR